MPLRPISRYKVVSGSSDNSDGSLVGYFDEVYWIFSCGNDVIRILVMKLVPFHGATETDGSCKQFIPFVCATGATAAIFNGSYSIAYRKRNDISNDLS